MTIRYCCIEGNRIMLSTLVTDIEAAGPLHSQFSLDPMEASDLADGWHKMIDPTTASWCFRRFMMV